MAHIQESGYKSFIADVNIPGGTAVKMKAGSVTRVVPAAAAADVSIGTIHSDAKANQAIDVRLRSAQGTLNIVAGATIAQNDAVTSNGSGLGIPTTTAGHQVIGYALEGGAAGAWVELIPTVSKY